MIHEFSTINDTDESLLNLNGGLKIELKGERADGQYKGG